LALPVRQGHFAVREGLADGVVQWKLAGQDAWTDVTGKGSDGSFTLEGIDLSASDPTVDVCVIDAAGNIGDTISRTIDGPFAPKLILTPTVDGLEVTSPVAGTLMIAFGTLHSTDESRGAIAGTVLVETQEYAKGGRVQVVPEGGGANLTEEAWTSYYLGSTANNTLTGQYQWGFDGDDILTGTDGDDFLSGGNDSDIILSKGGRDTISGGSGADKITLVADQQATDQGFAKSGEVIFAGGQDGPFHHQGFALADFREYLGGANYGNAVSMNQGFSTSPLANGAIIHTSGGNDVVVDTGGRLIVEYDAINNAAQDLILGLRSDERVRISGEVAALIEKDGNEGIQWNENIANGRTEGLTITVREDNGVEADSSVLFIFQNLQNDGLVQANELTTIAMFADGAITTGSVELISTQTEGGFVTEAP